MKNLQMKFETGETPTGLSINEAKSIEKIYSFIDDIDVMLKNLKDYGTFRKILFGRGGSHIWGKRVLSIGNVSDDRIIFIEF